MLFVRHRFGVSVQIAAALSLLVLTPAAGVSIRCTRIPGVIEGTPKGGAGRFAGRNLRDGRMKNRTHAALVVCLATVFAGWSAAPPCALAVSVGAGYLGIAQILMSPKHMVCFSIVRVSDSAS